MYPNFGQSIRDEHLLLSFERKVLRTIFTAKHANEIEKTCLSVSNSWFQRIWAKFKQTEPRWIDKQWPGELKII